MKAPLTMVCRKCKEERPFDAFVKHKKSRYGRQNLCRQCKSAGVRARRKQGHEITDAHRTSRALAARKRWAQLSREEKREIAKAKANHAAVKLNDGYLKAAVRKHLRIPYSDVTAEMCAIKREQLTFRRFAKSVRLAVKEQNNETQPNRS